MADKRGSWESDDDDCIIERVIQEVRPPVDILSGNRKSSSNGIIEQMLMKQANCGEVGSAERPIVLDDAPELPQVPQKSRTVTKVEEDEEAAKETKKMVEDCVAGCRGKQYCENSEDWRAINKSNDSSLFSEGERELYRKAYKLADKWINSQIDNKAKVHKGGYNFDAPTFPELLDNFNPDTLIRSLRRRPSNFN